MHTWSPLLHIISRHTGLASTMTAIRRIHSKSKEQTLTYLWVIVRKGRVSIKSLDVRALHLSRAAKANIKDKKASHDSCCCHTQQNLEWQTSSIYAWKRDSGIHCRAVKTLLMGASSPHDSTALKWSRMHGFLPAKYSSSKTWRGCCCCPPPEMCAVTWPLVSYWFLISCHNTARCNVVTFELQNVPEFSQSAGAFYCKRFN